MPAVKAFRGIKPAETKHYLEQLSTHNLTVSADLFHEP